MGIFFGFFSWLINLFEISIVLQGLNHPLPEERPSHMGDDDDIAKAVTMSLKVCGCLVSLLLFFPSSFDLF